MRRREFIAGLGGAAAWPVVAWAQQQALPVIGFLGGVTGATIEPMREYLAAFYRGLAEIGYTENRNVRAEYRWAEDDYGRLPSLAADLVRRRVAIIVVLGSTPGALAAKAATPTIPIVYLIGTDPVKVGLATSLARPSGNLTGVTVINVELIAKCLQLMHQLVPAVTTIAVLVNPANPIQTETETRDVRDAARVLGLRVVVLNASRPGEIDSAFETLFRERAGALVVSGEYFFDTQADRLVALAARYAVPTIYQYRHYTTTGGLMNYGPNVADAYRIVGNYAGRVLKGEKPADLPVQQVTRIDLVLNMKTAKALGLTVPESIIVRADEVFE
jgi:putative tryptophan/tyrosine transport system substrate-binding protein